MAKSSKTPAVPIYYKVWVKIEVERCDYNSDTYEDLEESEPIDVATYTTQGQAEAHYKALVDLSEIQSAAALRVRLGVT